MKINSDFIVDEFADESVLINQANKQRNLAELLTLNSSARLLFDRLSRQEFAFEDVIRILMETYSISIEEASNGAEIWIESMKKHHVIE